MAVEDFEYVGECVVCGDEPTHSDAGFCHLCGQPFCWSHCGSWQNGQHTCDDCMQPEESDY